MEKQKIDQDFLKNHGKNLFSNSKNARTVTEQSWVKSTTAYDSRFSSDEKKKSDVLMGQSRLFIPKTYNTVQRILTDIMDTIFFDPEEIVSVKSDKQTPNEIRQCVKALLNCRLNGHPIDFYKEAYEAVLDSLKNKVGILKVFPRLKTTPIEKKSKKKDDDGVEVEVISTEDRVVAFEPCITCVPPEDLFIDPAATWKDYWNYPMIHRIAKSRDALRRGGFKNIDAVGTTQNPSLFDDNKNARNPDFSTATIIRDVDGQEQIYDYEIWTFLDLEKEGKLESCVYHMLGGSQGPEVIGKDPVENTLPYKFSEFESARPPFFVGFAFPESHRFYGKDLPEVTDALQKETNILRNQDREAAAIAIRKPILVNRDAGVDMAALINRKIGGVVLADETGAEAVRELQTSNPTINTAAISARIDQDYFETTSITPGQLGVSVRDETATAVTSNQSNANKKINNAIRNLVKTLFIPTFNALLRLEQAYESDAFIQMVTGKILGWRFPNDGNPAWNQINGEFDLVVELGVGKQSQLNKHLLIADRINQTNAMNMQLVQSGVVSPEQIKFLNPMWSFKEIASVLKQKNIDEMTMQAQQPPPPPEVGLPGLASQPRQGADPSQEVGQMNPEALNEILG